MFHRNCNKYQRWKKDIKIIKYSKSKIFDRKKIKKIDERNINIESNNKIII